MAGTPAWLIEATSIFPLNIAPANVGVLVVAMSCGKLSTTSPFIALAITWLLVPVILSTPVLEMVILPAPLRTPIPSPALIAPKAKPAPVPISKLPCAAALESMPVPPNAAPNTPLFTLLAFRSVKAAPLPIKLLAVTLLVNVAALPDNAPVMVALAA